MEDSLIGRTIRVIEAAVEAGEPVGPRGLARVTGIDRSAVSRILLQLADLGVLERVSGGYVPGDRLAALGRVVTAGDSLPKAAGPVLKSLVEQFDETCYICVARGDHAVFIHEVQSTHPLRLVVQLGKPVPLHAGAAGRAILAGMPEVAFDELVEELILDRRTAATITSVRALRAAAVGDRRRGFSVSVGERIEGGLSVAAPFFDERDRCQGSVVFTAPQSRVEETDVAEIGRAVRSAGRGLSARLGSSAGWYATVSSS